MSDIHPTAIVSPEAQIGKNVEVGPFCVIGNCILGDAAVVHSHAVIADGVVIGPATEIFPGAFIGKEPKGAGATSRQPQFDRHIQIGSDCSVGPHAIIYYDVDIGSGTLVGDGASIREQCVIGDSCIISRYVSINYNTRVGNRVKVMDMTHLTGNMTIGDDAFISASVVTLNDNLIRAGFGDHIVGPVVAAGSTVGGGAILMPGVSIAENAIVAAGAVVTRNVERGTRVAGVPAKSF